jgi:twitching motility protein PilU
VDTESFYEAMRNCLRQRPDVILVGEIRDRHAMEQALTIASSGHLCLATLHTNNAYQAIERIINLFPEEAKDQIRLGLSLNLRAIVSQRLIPACARGVVPAVEVLLNEGLVREIILQGDLHKITSILERNTSQGMATFDQSILDLYARGLITEEAAISHADRAADLKIKLQQVKMRGSKDVLRAMDTSFLALAERE